MRIKNECDEMKREPSPIVNRVKIVLAVLVLIFDLMGAMASWMRVFYPGVVTFLLLGAVTLDYIRITRRELKLGPWYELESIDK